jgi:hypothetical protein
MPLSLGCSPSSGFTNKVSLNLLQDRLACASQLSLKGVITTNLVVKFLAKSGQLAQRQAHSMGSQSVAIAGFFFHLHRDLGIL